MKWPGLNPGELRHQVTILGPRAITDVSGASVEYVPVMPTDYAKIEAATATDLIKAGQTTAQLGLVVSMNWRAGVESEMQMDARGGRYVIKAVENVLELDVTLRITCVALGKNQ